MNLVKCKRGHFYDGDKYAVCPHCSDEGTERRYPEIRIDAQKKITRCPNGHFYDSGKYATCPHCASMGYAVAADVSPNINSGEGVRIIKFTPTAGKEGTPFQNGMKCFSQWFFFTVLLAGIPLIFYLLLCIAFGMKREFGLTELAAFFFGVTTPVLFEHQMGIDLKDNALLRAVKYIVIFSFVFFCMFYGYIYIKNFKGEALTSKELDSCMFLILAFGSGSFLLTGVSQFCGGYYAE